LGEVTTATIIFSIVGVVFVVLGIPLFQGRVPPNAWYGCRTKKSLSDQEIWYAVNRVTGQDMIIAGILVVTSSLAMFIFGPKTNPNNATVVLLSILILSTAGMVIHSLTALKRM
jgi:uncharacterized membrane protein